MRLGGLGQKLRRYVVLVEESPHILSAVVVFYLLPFVMPSPYWTRILSTAFVFALFAMAYDLALGFTGLPSFGHAAIFGMGAYAMVWCLRAGLPLPLALLASCAMGSALGGVMASFLKRVQEVYYAMVTLALAEIIHMLMDKAVWLSGGFTGLRVPRPVEISSEALFISYLALSLLAFIVCFVALLRKLKMERSRAALAYLMAMGIVLLLFLSLGPSLIWEAFYTPVYRLILGLYFVSFTALWVSYVVLRRVVNSAFGSALVGIRENEERMEALGYDTSMYKMMAMVISGLFTGLAGGLLALVSLRPVTPSVLGAEYTIEALLYSILGGLGTLVGPMLGAGIVVFLDMRLRPFFGAYWFLFTGILIVLIMLFLPYGIVGTLLLKRVSAKRLFSRLIKSLRKRGE